MVKLTCPGLFIMVNCDRACMIFNVPGSTTKFLSLETLMCPVLTLPYKQVCVHITNIAHLVLSNLQVNLEMYIKEL